MTIPKKFKEIIEKDQTINGIVNYCVAQYSEILSENQLYFFEEYTDHGIRHIESLLNSSVQLITESTWKKVLKDSPKSLGVYVLAVILHDIGMHLTADGFHSLICGKNDQIRISELDSKTWKELWEDFLDEARRFGDNEKLNIIGNVDWQFHIPNLDNKDKLTGEDKKLIGEFIRKNHPRIAHEIAILGFPTQTKNIPFASELELEMRNMCGLVARSHGIEIRTLFPYLENNYLETWVKPHNIELFFLMVVLRIADYFQIDSSRTPEIIVKLKTFNSPISQLEHFKHLDVKYIQIFSKDPETLIFYCEPRNSLIFLKLQSLFSEIQKELDKSWAILGEIYGKELKEKQPSISFRRLKSNIDRPEEFSKKVNYVPENIRFTVSSELPKLLIGPLYGDDPSYGIRELLQNAVDACREREFLEGTNYNGEITISFFFENGDCFFKIEDNGIGMTLNVIKKYFLEVGNSFRKSTHWKKEFLDYSGSSKIQRSGKFGIGVLAAFLIGNRIILQTKNSSSQHGYAFETDLNLEQIEVRKISKSSIGTSILIPVNNECLVSLSKSKYRFDKWFTQSSPSVIYNDLTDLLETLDITDLGYVTNYPNYYEKHESYWQELKDRNYNKIHWTYNPGFCKSGENGILTCNGIIIPEALIDYKFKIKTTRKIRLSYWTFCLPSISVFDFNGNFPLTLNRNGIEKYLPFEVGLIKSVFKDIIAKLLVCLVESPFSTQTILIPSNNTFYHPAIGELTIIYSESGYALKIGYFGRKNLDKPFLKFCCKRSFDIIHISDVKMSFIDIDRPEDLNERGFAVSTDIVNIKHGCTLVLDKRDYNFLFNPGYYTRFPKKIIKNHNIISSDNNSIHIGYKLSKSNFTIVDLSTNLDSCHYIMESKMVELTERENIDFENILNELLEELLEGASRIPYDIEQRKAMFPRAFLELDTYFTKHI